MTNWNLETNEDLTSEPGTAAGLTTAPPLTPAQRIAARPANYGKPFVPPTPQWYTNSAGTPIPGGQVTPTTIQLFWHSNVGQIAASANNKGSRGLDGIGIGAHNLYINGATSPSLTIRGPKLTTVLTGYWSAATPPVWTPLAPNTAYTVVVEACDTTLVASGNKSAALSVTTPATSTTSQQVTLPPEPAGGVALAAPLPVLTSNAGGVIQLSWVRSPHATSYEIWDNNTAGTTLKQDPANLGLYLGDTRVVASVPQPALPATTVTASTPAYTVPRTPVRLRVRAVRTDGNGTAYSSWSPTVYATIPAALNAPATASAPTLNGTVSAGLVKLNLTAPTVSTSNGAPEWYAVYDGTKRVAYLTAPLGAAPQVTLQYGLSQAYSFTVVCGNSQGVAPASAALTGTTPAT
ncbi:hypothetical protein [Saccharothrix sp. ST-888]|uniref:hypothetical protein n=1 Tax=Saccharothrix sp. ST-888 TaxID=1427391 RepID=UPI0005EC6675|nr:hypothetical protein [Saccharothrix sp. ST-888]KJK56231.1 hypothetical protein UK12_23905 [Saccharothrix sp. ST-888]